MKNEKAWWNKMHHVFNSVFLYFTILLPHVVERRKSWKKSVWMNEEEEALFFIWSFREFGVEKWRPEPRNNSGDCWVQKRNLQIYIFSAFSSLFIPTYFIFIHFNVSIECFLILVNHGKFVKIYYVLHFKKLFNKNEKKKWKWEWIVKKSCLC
jgi:hypothetical protein